MAHPCSPGRRRLRVAASAYAPLVLVAALGLSACGGPAPAPPTAHVQRGTVALKVSASGALSSVDSQNLGFRTGARLTELDVKIGDTVKPGQLLAKIDNFRTTNARQVAKAALDSAQANLDKAVRGVLVPNARDVLNQAERSFDKVKKSVAAQIKSAHVSEHRANVKYAYDLRALRTANWKARRAGCDTSNSDESNLNDTSRRPDRLPPATSEGGMATGMDATGGTSSGGTSPAGSPSTGGSSDGSALTGLAGAAAPTPAAAPCTTAPDMALQTAANAAFATALASKSAYESAKAATKVAENGAQVTIEMSRTALVTARTGLRAATVDRPTTISQLAALVASAQASLFNADQDLRDTVLFSPVGGTVSAINGTIGEFVGSGSGTSAQSPGSDAPIPGVGAAASSDQAGNAASGISATKPGGSAFLVLNNINTFQVVVPFEESDAAKIKPNQKVEVNFDSLPGLERDGTVLSIAPNGVNISGVTNYYATILLSQTDPRLKSGLTAEAGVLVSQLDNVLTVPNSAITKRDGRSYVKVAGPDGKPREQEFEPGMVGDSSTQVLSGLREGQAVLPPNTPT
jgi:HlyD family secretion protein